VSSITKGGEMVKMKVREEANGKERGLDWVKKMKRLTKI